MFIKIKLCSSTSYFHDLLLCVCSGVFLLLHFHLCDISFPFCWSLPTLKSLYFAKVLLSILSSLHLQPWSFLFQSHLFSVTPTFHFVYPLKQVIQDNLPPSASLFMGNRTVGSGAFLSQQSASSSWRKSAGFHHGRTSLSKRYRRIYQHPCSFPLIWSWKPGHSLSVLLPRAISEFHFPPTCWFL